MKQERNGVDTPRSLRRYRVRMVKNFGHILNCVLKYEMSRETPFHMKNSLESARCAEKKLPSPSFNTTIKYHKHDNGHWLKPGRSLMIGDECNLPLRFLAILPNPTRKTNAKMSSTAWPAMSSKLL